MIVVKKQKGKSDDWLINTFRKKVVDEGLLTEVRDRQRYKKPSQKRKEKKYKIAHLIELEKKRNQ